jgi:hypothetical protein
MFQHTSGSKSDSSSVPYHTVGKLLEVFPPRRTNANNDSLVFPVFGAKHNMTEAASPVSILYGLLCNSAGRRVQNRALGQRVERHDNLVGQTEFKGGSGSLARPMHAH